jgi:hypothetical protein
VVDTAKLQHQTVIAGSHQFRQPAVATQVEAQRWWTSSIYFNSEALVALAFALRFHHPKGTNLFG